MRLFNEKEIEKLFVKKIIPYLESGSELPPVNFIINNEELKEYAFNIRVHDKNLFYYLLTNIVNKVLCARETNDEVVIRKDVAFRVLTRIWLRLNINDFDNIEDFLKQQNSFMSTEHIASKFFPDEIAVDGDNHTYVYQSLNRTWDETYYSLCFYEKNVVTNKEHTLPKVLFDIDGDTCYIYGVQMPNKRERDKKFERKLYKLNDGISNPLVHPNHVYSMILFINYIKSKGINKIKVPLIQVLSYDFHVLMGNNIEKEFEEKWKAKEARKSKEIFNFYNLWKKVKFNFNKESKSDIERYKKDYEMYLKIYGKEDQISRLKTENLLNIIYRMEYHIDGFKILNDIDSSDGYLYIKLDELEKRKKL